MFRPFGQIDWVFERLGRSDWALLGCHGTEERCSTAGISLARLNKLATSDFITITDPPSRYSAQAGTYLQTTLLELNGLPNVQYTAMGLLDSLDSVIAHVDGMIDNGKTNVVLDISCFPKRFFFPIIKRLLRDSRVENLVATYTVPAAYASDEDAPLSEQNATLDYLPAFQPIDSPYIPKRLIASVGYVVLGLSQIVQEAKSQQVDIDLLFPFPPGPPSYQRNWRFVLDTFEFDGTHDADIFRIDGLDVSETYNRLLSLTGNGKTNVWLAPFGSKPMSLAMALFGIYHGAPVYYTQPSLYRPDYSTGVATINTNNGAEKEACYAYPLRLSSRDLYGRISR
jgi:hypothetical protein